MSDLVGNPEDRFSHNEAQFVSSRWFLTKSDINRDIQPQKMARGLKFQIYEVEELYYLCSKIKGVDQLRCYHAADPRLCFRICKKMFFS